MVTMNYGFALCLGAILLLNDGVCAFSSLHSRRNSVGVSEKHRSNRIRAALLKQSKSGSEDLVESTTIQQPGTSVYPFHAAEFDTELTLPSYNELVRLSYGECHVTDPFMVVTKDKSYDFRVKFYPRGGGQGFWKPSDKEKIPFSVPTKSGFGMSYSIEPMWGKPVEKVGVYLQYLPKSDADFVDASFALKLKGNQLGKKFDVEWRAGMRFVPLSESKLALGRANDFGAHLMQFGLLSNFVGARDDSLEDDNSTVPLKLQVVIVIHNTRDAKKNAQSAITANLVPKQGIIEDLRNGSDPEDIRVGKIVVPVLNNLAIRPKMFQLGIYPGVEYRILRIVDSDSKQDAWYRHADKSVEYDLKPIYPLVRQLERSWPVRVKDSDIPKLLSPNMYNVLSAVGSLFAAVSALAAAFTISQVISLFVIPSLSMDPTLQKGDVVLVEKLSPKIFKSQKAGDVIFFKPPESLQQLIAEWSGGRVPDRDLFVKRVAAVAGDTIQVESDGSVRINNVAPTVRRDLCQAEPLKLIERYIIKSSDVNVAEIKVMPNQVGVLGDCSSVSIDSRVWGALSNENIIGRPLIRIWPLERFGPIPSLHQ